MKTFKIILMLTKSFTTAIVSAYNLVEAMEQIKTQFPTAQIVEMLFGTCAAASLTADYV